MTQLCNLLLFLLSIIQASNANTWGDPRIYPAIQINITDAEPPKYNHLVKRAGCSDGYFLCKSEAYTGCCPNGSLCNRLTAQCSVGTCGPKGNVCPFYGCCYAGQYCGNDGWCYPMNSTATGLPPTELINPTYQASVATSEPTSKSASSNETVKIGLIASLILLFIMLLVV